MPGEARAVSLADPELASLQQVSIATLESVQALLPKQTTLIEYFTTGDEILAFIVSPDAVSTASCPGSWNWMPMKRGGVPAFGSSSGTSRAPVRLMFVMRHMYG